MIGSTRLSLSLAEANGSSLSPEHAAAAGRMIDQLAGRVKALEDLNALLVEQRDTALSSAESAEGRARRAEENLRHAWEHGIKIARSYGDNIVHLEGDQKERQWNLYLAALASPPATAAPTSVPAEDGAENPDHIPVRYTPRERDTRTFPAEIPTAPQCKEVKK